MKIIERPEQLRSWLAPRRLPGRLIGFVPTMGNLHDGHMALVRRACTDADLSVVSIFVNPAQFSPAEDFDSYPRTLADDLARLEALEVDLVFVPPTKTIYPRGPGPATRVEVPRLGEQLCGESRPHFFRGVCTVVSILFHIVQPDIALFGQKDLQQLLVIRRMVSDLSMPISIRGVATVREPDGLAMSSRNCYLDARARARAPGLYRALCRARSRLSEGDEDHDAIEAEGLAQLRSAGFEADYFSIRRCADLEPPASAEEDLVVLGAGWLGGARLIDNVLVREGRIL